MRLPFILTAFSTLTACASFAAFAVSAPAADSVTLPPLTLRQLPPPEVFIAAHANGAPASASAQGGLTANSAPEAPASEIPEPAKAAPGEWLAPVPAAAQNYTDTRKTALAAETAGNSPAALTAWERVLDRTTCTEEQRSEARTHIKALRPKVAPANTDPAKARPWRILALVYKELDFEWTNPATQKQVQTHKIMVPENYAAIGQSLASFRDFVFTWSSGILLPQIDVVVVTEPLKSLSGSRGRYYVGVKQILPAAKKAFESTQYDTVISYAKFRGGEGNDVQSPWRAAIQERVGELGGAAHMMIPWDGNLSRKGTQGETEMHEWLHQIDAVVHNNLGYPGGTTRSPDDWRGAGDPRPGGEQEYRKPKGLHTWLYFYRHIGEEHLTRQIWSEVTITRPENRPGALVKIVK